MTWTLRASAVLLALWIAFSVSPLISLYNLERAVQANDIDGVRRRLNLRALRMSLLRQTVQAALDTAKGRELDPARRQAVTEAAMGFADPIVAGLVTPEAIGELIRTGWTERLPLERRGGAVGLRIGSLAQLWSFYVRSEWRGFRTYVLAYPLHVAADAQYRLRLRLSGARWRLVDVELPADLKRQLVQEFEQVAK
jgi:hypothetical protein